MVTLPREVNAIMLTALMCRKADAANFDVVADHDQSHLVFDVAASGGARKG
jgi:hypothetical protein